MRIQQLEYLEKIVEAGSINEAAKRLFLTQPSLSNAVKELENEMGIQIFQRSSGGISLTAEGREFMTYSKQILDQVNLMNERYKNGQQRKQSFSVSAQHYAFVVHAFVELIKSVNAREYQFTLRETETQNIFTTLLSSKASSESSIRTASTKKSCSVSLRKTTSSSRRCSLPNRIFSSVAIIRSRQSLPWICQTLKTILTCHTNKVKSTRFTSLKKFSAP